MMPVNQQGDSPLNGLVSTVVLRASAPLEVIKTTVRNVLLRAHPDAEPMRVFVEESCFQTA